MQGTWDADRILQIMSNLVRNAATHDGAPEGPIRFELDGRDPDQVRIEVNNQGHIPADRASTLFDPFTRVHDQRSRTEGLGLGLYIVDQLARAHGGEVHPVVHSIDRHELRGDPAARVQLVTSNSSRKVVP